MSSFACGRIHQGLDPERFSDESQGRRKIYMYLAEFGVPGGTNPLRAADIRVTWRVYLACLGYFLRAYCNF